MRGAMTLIGCLRKAVAATPAAQQPTLSTSTTTILFGVVAGDRKGLPIRDMAATEFELSEDGACQKDWRRDDGLRALLPAPARPLPFALLTLPRGGPPQGACKQHQLT